MSYAHLAERGSLTRRAAYASIALAIILTGLKSWAALASGSVAMLGSLADSALDLLAALITLWGVWLGAKPADHDHRFGHGKAEALAAMFQVMLIAVSAAAIAYQAVKRLLAGAQTKAPELGITVSLLAIVLTLLLTAYQRRIVAQTGSVAIQADHVHYQTDLLLNGAVIVALLLDQWLRIPGIDAAFGLVIAGWLLWGAWQAASAAIDQLMDKEWPEDKRARFLAVASQHPELADIHDLRTRSSGALDFVQFHVRVDPAMTVVEAHRVMDEVEAKLAQEFPGVEILIHPDPARH
jgi:ferrous-iron efflux pump FieF